MKKLIYTSVFMLLGAMASFAQSERSLEVNGSTIPLNESSTYIFKFEEGNKLNFYELLESFTLTETPTVITAHTFTTPEHEMVFVEGGTFTMGCTSEQGDDCFDWEKPAHQVTVSSFNIGKYPVTQAQWVAIMENNPSQFKGENLPVENVSWNDAQDFIRKLNAATGKTYRLPTEAEWEFAARGGTQSQGYKYSGSNNINEVVWFTDNSENTTRPVGTKQPNELGIYDMNGNVWEWCSDWSSDNYSGEAQTNPQGPNFGYGKMMRGGGWRNEAQHCRVSFRIQNPLNHRTNDGGFRLVLVP